MSSFLTKSTDDIWQKLSLINLLLVLGTTFFTLAYFDNEITKMFGAVLAIGLALFKARPVVSIIVTDKLLFLMHITVLTVQVMMLLGMKAFGFDKLMQLLIYVLVFISIIAYAKYLEKHELFRDIKI